MSNQLYNNMEKSILVNLVSQNLSIREIAAKTNMAPTTVRWWLKKFELKTNLEIGNKYGKARKPKHLFVGENPDVHYCNQCGEIDKNKFYKNTKTKCSKCSRLAVFNRLRENKKLAVEYKGGKCVKCGYSKCQAALDFHHSDPSQKDPDWKKMRSWKFEKIIDELDKCILVCRNCHSEIHYF